MELLSFTLRKLLSDKLIKITIGYFFYGDNPANSYNSIQQVKFDDGTVWDASVITALMFAGTSAVDSITGTLNADTINGLGGNDFLSGGDGNDSLGGGSSNDTYLLGSGSNADTISDSDSTAGNTDVLSTGSDVAFDQLWFRRVGSDLKVSIIGTGDKSTISSWYSGSIYHVEQFKTSDGKVLLDTQVENLVSAMASFAPPAAGQTTLSSEYDAALAPVIAANWQ
jgi:Ca2+-binding RTX toxin-like protein